MSDWSIAHCGERRKRQITAAGRAGVVLVLALLVTACSHGTSPASGVGRSYYLGFTPFPYSLSQPDGLSFVYSTIPQMADLTVHEFDAGIPWTEAITDSYPYNSNLMGDWNLRKANTAAGQKVLVQINPIDITRSHLADFWNSSGQNQPLTSPWSTYALNDPNVKQAFLNYCVRVIQFFHPDYLVIGIEVNQLMMNAKTQWSNYIDLHVSTYQSLKAQYPTLPVFVSMAATNLLSGYTSASVADQTTALGDISGYEDFFGLSVYLYISSYLTNSLPSDAFDRLAALSSKKIFVTESGYPAQSFSTVGPPANTFTTTPSSQQSFVDLMLSAADKYGFEAVVSYLLRDYDASFGTADSTLTFRYIGLYDDAGNARPAATDWEAKLALPKQ